MKVETQLNAKPVTVHYTIGLAMTCIDAVIRDGQDIQDELRIEELQCLYTQVLNEVNNMDLVGHYTEMFTGVV